MCVCWRKPHAHTQYSGVETGFWVAHSCVRVPAGQKRWRAPNVMWRSHPNTQLQLQRDQNRDGERPWGRTKNWSRDRKKPTTSARWPVYQEHQQWLELTQAHTAVLRAFRMYYSSVVLDCAGFSCVHRRKLVTEFASMSLQQLFEAAQRHSGALSRMLTSAS